MGVEGKEAPALGPGPHRTSSRSVRALGFSRYFSRARQAEMRSGLSSILPRADEGEFILGALALASWVSSTHHVQLGCSQRVSTLCPVALTQSCQGSPEWWNLRPPSFSDTFTWHPKGQTWGTQTPRENGHRGQTLFQMARGRWKSFSEDVFFIKGRNRRHTQDGHVGQNVPKKVGDLRTDLACPLNPNPNSPNCPPQALYQSHQIFRCPERESVRSLIQTKVYMTDGSFLSEGLNGGI